MGRLRLATWVPLAAVMATALVLSFPPPQHPDQQVKLFPDSVTYLQWTIFHPPTAFLFYQLVGRGFGVCIAQTVLSVVCWTLLGWTALGTVGAVCGAALAASLPVALWNYAVLSESLALSLGAALLAATLGLGRQWTRPRFIAWSACVLLFTGVREENFIIVPILCAALLVWHRARWRALGAVGVTAAAMFLVFSVVLDKESTNWQTRMTNVVLTRILPDANLAAEFYVRGMPREASMLNYRGQMLEYYNADFRAQTPLFQHWLDGDSRAMYLRWLATETPHRYLITYMDMIMARAEYDYYTAGVHLPGTAADLARLYDAVAIPLRRWVWLAAGPLLCAVLERRVRFVDLFALAYLVSVYVLTFVVYHADSGELGRHMVLVAALYRLAPVIVLACAWERLSALAHWWFRRSDPAPAAP